MKSARWCSDRGRRRRRGGRGQRLAQVGSEMRERWHLRIPTEV